MTDHPKPPDVDAAAELLKTHVADDGWCRGCRQQWSRLVPYPCTQAEWARHVDEASEDLR